MLALAHAAACDVGAWGANECHVRAYDAEGQLMASRRKVAVGAGGRAIYVGDCLNHRVARVDKTSAAEVTLKPVE